MKKGVKIAIYTAICCVPIAFIVAFSIPHSNLTHISCVGSSGVKPFVEALATDFSNEYPGYDITTDAGGSGFGISQVAQGFTNIGNASKNPYEAVREEYQKEWEEKDIKTLTFGWEAICVVYIPPKGLSQQALNDLNSILTINSLNITNLYRSFSGFNDGLDESKPNLGMFYNDSANLSTSDQEILNNTQLIPYVRAGGSLTSGTAASFYDGSHYDNAKKDLTADQQKAFSNGNYGNDFRVVDTDEANSRAWDLFSKTNEPGSCVYLSSGFVEQNYDLIQKYGYGIFAYDGLAYDVSSIATGYNFYRPLNMMFSVSDLSNPTIEFANYILNEVDEQTFENLGAKKVTSSDIASMSIDGDIWKSDYQIMLHNHPDDLWSDGLVFGAGAE